MINDTIDRQAAIQTAERMYKRCDTGSIEDYHDLMVEALTALPPAPEQRWIPCSERLPELNEDVLVFDRMGEMRISTFSKINETPFWWQDVHGYWDSLDSVTAWMPLPKCYGEED